MCVYIYTHIYTPTRLSRWLIGGSVTRYIYGGQAATTFGGDERVGVRIGPGLKRRGEVSLASLTPIDVGETEREREREREGERAAFHLSQPWCGFLYTDVGIPRHTFAHLLRVACTFVYRTISIAN